MNKIIIFTAILGFAAAAPGVYLSHGHEETHYHVPVVHTVSSPSKTTITKTSNEVNHGGQHVVHVPTKVHYVHEPVHYVHQEPVHTLVHAPVHVEHKHIEPAKSSQYFKLENTQYETKKVITPVVHKVVTPVVSVAPVVHAVHAPVVSHVRSGDSAVSHHSSTVHETVHEVKHLPVYSYHH
ncbi:hypothetical protein NE865_03482 [Phthorimaea operculella]|nr:hypothetical protein NE865_03482 [Phthorimaea operculella]